MGGNLKTLVNRSAKKRESGIITFLTASALVFVILPFVGLAIDGGVAYAVKAKLQTAVDGWQLFSVKFDPSLVSTDRIRAILKEAGALIIPAPVAP